MTNTTTLKRAAGLASIIGAAAGLSAVPTASATQYATGWQCISPFVNTFGTPTDRTKSDVLHVPAGSPEGFLDSLDVSISRQSNPLWAVKGQALYLDGAELSLQFKHPDPLRNLWRRNGGIGLTFTGVPGWANVPNDATGTPTWTDAALGAPNGAPTDGTTTRSISIRTNPADNLSYWSYSVGSGSSAVIHYAPEPISGSRLTTRNNVPQPKTHPGTAAPTASASMGHQYLVYRNNNNFPITSYVTIEGTNTVEKFQTVRVDGYWTVNVTDPTPGSPTNTDDYLNGDETITAPKKTFAVPASKWTPTGDGPVEFRIAPPGNSAPVLVESKGYDRDGYNRPVKVKPFGSVFVRAETKSYASSNDCVNGTVAVKDSTISTGSNASFIGNSSPDPAAPENSLLGDVEFPGKFLANSGGGFNPNTVRGVAGRYEFTQQVQPAFAKADVPAAPAPAPAPVPAPAPAPVAAPVALTATVLGVEKKKTKVEVTNNTGAANEYTVSVTTKKQYKSGKSRKKLSVAPTRTVKVEAGKSVPTSMSIKKAIRSKLKTRSIDVVVTVTPKGGTPTSYTVTLTNL